MTDGRCDVTILGGGLAGLSLALQLRAKLPKAEITVLEKREHPVPEAAHKVGESTVEVGAHYFGEVLGLKSHILQDQLPKFGLRFFFPAGDNRRIEERLELGGKRFAPCPSYQIDRGRFENYLADTALAQNIKFLDEASVESVEIASRKSPYRVTYRRGAETSEVASRWIVDASGRRAILKRQLGLEKSSPHLANAAWFRFKKHIKIDDWSDNPAWQAGHSGKFGRWYSTNHLMGRGYWVWLIPLASGSTSMGIVATEAHHPLSEINSLEKAIAWLKVHEPQCAQAALDHLDDVQDFRAIKHYAVEAKQVFSAKRWGITGEAGFFHDPFYSPGSDFIAMANTMLTDLIHRDLSGRGFRTRALSYDGTYKRFYYGTLTAYQDQYELFGNPTVMPVKILWDYLMYWSITAFIFMQGRTCQQWVYLRQYRNLKRLGDLNHLMQQFFRKWHEATADLPSSGVIDISTLPIVREFNARLLAAYPTKQFHRRFAANVAQLETLGKEIITQSGIDQPYPFAAARRSTTMENAFEGVFHPAAYEEAAVTC